MEFDLRFLDELSRNCLQHAIDGVNKAAVLHDPGAWNFVSAGGLIEANKDRGRKKASEMDPVVITIFDEMEQDGHSGGTASWTIHSLTNLAKNYKEWRSLVLTHSLTYMKNELNSFIKRTFGDKFPEEDVDDFEKKQRVLHELEHSYIVNYILDSNDRNVLKYVLKMEDVSHLGNEVLFDQIDQQLKVL